jgi:hypothetical protein
VDVKKVFAPNTVLGAKVSDEINDQVDQNRIASTSHIRKNKKPSASQLADVWMS